MGTRVLVVDDDEMNRDVLSRRLQRNGYEVVCACDGLQALEILDSQRVELVLLDEMMPGISGTEVLRRIRLKFSASHLPVIMVTAVSDSRHVAGSLRNGANDYITKPLDWPVAQARIETRLSLASNDRDMRQTTELYRLASSAADEGLWDWDLTADRIVCSPRWTQRLGYDDGEFGERSADWRECIHSSDLPTVRALIQKVVTGDAAHVDVECRMRRKDGTWAWVVCRAGVSRNAAGQAVRLAGHLIDITPRKAVDPVTGLPNRVWLESELEGASGNGGTALLLIELDGFDRYTESVSPKQSQRIIQTAARRLQDCVAEIPFKHSARLVSSGEHQFAMLLRPSLAADELQRAATELKQALRDGLRKEAEAASIALLAGMAQAAAGETLTSLFRDAQSAMRQARECSVSGAVVFDAAMRRREADEIRLEADLRRAIEEQEFVVYYQPKVDLRSGSIAGFEALVRWQRPGHGLVGPNDFIPLAERNGMIVPIGMWVLARACEDTAVLRRVFPHAEVSVNVSGRQFSEPDLVEQVQRVLDATGLHPDALRLEVTETVLVNDARSALETMRHFREMGVGLKLDDFGAGYSSLTYLQQFPFDTLKIDRSFVTGMTQSDQGRAIVRAIIDMARSLKMDVVAEGIEQREQACELRSMGCQYGQGYLFSKPVDIVRLRQLLAGWVMPRLENDQTRPWEPAGELMA